MADGDQLWSVPKLVYDLLRRNASTNIRKTDLIERYILHRKPKYTIYVRYFSILLYLLNVQVAPTEKKTSLKLWWRISLNVLSWQDSETRPGEFVIFMLSIIIEKEDFEVNCLYKTRSWQMGFISRHMWGEKIIFIKKTDPTFYTPFLFIKYSKTTHWKHHIHVIIQNVKKRGIFSIEKKYGAFNRGTLVRFLRNILHLKKNIIFFHNFHNFFTMVSNHTLVQISLYSWLNGQYMLPY